MALGSIAQKIVDEHKERERQKMLGQTGEEIRQEKASEIMDGEKKLYSTKKGEIIDGEEAKMAEALLGEAGDSAKKGAEAKEQGISVIGEQLKKETWERCKYFKKEGGRDFCKQFMSFCVKDKCSPKIMRHIDDPELRKKYLKGDKRQ
ncbi:MAG: hypothetical protein WC308_03985 [archaeon]|jgi:hypothetical protein